jgi:hypothetical protein
MEAIEGGCLCGAVRYRAWGKAYVITHCHGTGIWGQDRIWGRQKKEKGHSSFSFLSGWPTPWPKGKL